MRRALYSCRKWWRALAAGGTILVLSGCDPTVRDTVLGGVEGAATGLVSAFIAAFFESLAVQDETVTTVKVLLEHAHLIVA